jgi:hypothetical protein
MMWISCEGRVKGGSEWGLRAWSGMRRVANPVIYSIVFGIIFLFYWLFYLLMAVGQGVGHGWTGFRQKDLHFVRDFVMVDLKVVENGL